MIDSFTLISVKCQSYPFTLHPRVYEITISLYVNKYLVRLYIRFSHLCSKQGYDPPSGYEMPYFRPTMGEAVQGHSLPSPQEVRFNKLLKNLYY